LPQGMCLEGLKNYEKVSSGTRFRQKFLFTISRIESTSSIRRTAVFGRYDDMGENVERNSRGLYKILNWQRKALETSFSIVCLVVGFQTQEALPDIKGCQGLARDSR
jgi:hypothetical protein